MQKTMQSRFFDNQFFKFIIDILSSGSEQGKIKKAATNHLIEKFQPKSCC